MTKAQKKKSIDKEIRGLKPRIKEISKGLLSEKMVDEIADWTGELMGKLTIDIVEDEKLQEHAFNQIFDQITDELIKNLKNKK